MSTPPAAQLMADHVLTQLAAHREKHAPSGYIPPLFVGVQGSQGCGKTYLTNHLTSLLSSPPNSLSLAVFSTDDLYLPHAALATVASTHPENKMLQGRGLPGTHDLPLGRQILNTLLSKGGRSTSAAPLTPEQLDPTPGSQPAPLVYLPSFWKDLFDGEGDRAPESSWNPVHGPVDVVILEGWSLGFKPLEEKALVRKYAIARAEASVRGAGVDMDDGEEAEDVMKVDKEAEGEDEEYAPPAFLKQELESLVEVNTFLGEYVESWYGFFEVFIQIVPPALSSIYRWRTQQEHHLQSTTESQCMTDEQVINFVDRYMPAYELFLEGVRSPDARWHGKGLAIQLGEEREIVGTSKF